MPSPPAFASASAQIQGVGDFSVDVPSGTTADDIITVVAFVDATASVTVMPSGFGNATNSPVVNNAASGNHKQYVMWKRATGSDVGTYDFTLSVGSVYRNVQAFRYTGAITTGDPWDVTASAIDITDGTASPPVTVVTTTPNTLLVWNSTNWSGGAWTPPTGFAERRDSGDRVASGADLAQTATGSSGAVSGSCAGSGKRTAWLGALKTADTGGAVAKDSSAVYLANQYAGTLSAQGIPTLTLGAALCVKAGISLTRTGTDAANVLASKSPPQLLTIAGALNVVAGTTNLTIQQALYKLNGGTP